MDFGQAIITLLGLQGVEIEDLKIYKKARRVELRVRQRRESCFCMHCGLQFSSVKEWDLKILRAPPLGVFQHIVVHFFSASRSVRELSSHFDVYC